MVGGIDIYLFDQLLKGRVFGEESDMQHRLIQIIGLAVTAVYAVVIIWLYATEPRSFKEVTTGAQVAAGTYQVDEQKFNAALELFRRDQFRAARDEWNRADPAQGETRVVQSRSRQAAVGQAAVGQSVESKTTDE